MEEAARDAARAGNPNPNPNPTPNPITLGGLSGIIPLLPVFSGEAGGPRVTDFFDSLTDVTKVAAWSKAQMLAVAKLKLTGIAREFVRKDRRIKEVEEFDEFKRLMIERFDREPFTFRLNRFYTCVQKRDEDVQTYAARLQALAMEIEITPEPGATATETAIIHRVQSKELDERLKAQFLNGIDIRIRQRTMSREPATFDDALKAAIREERIENLTAHPRGIMRTIREGDRATDSSPSLNELQQLTEEMKELKARMESLVRSSAQNGFRNPISRRNQCGSYTSTNYDNNPYNNSNLRRSEYHSNSPNHRYAQPSDRPSERSTSPRNDFQNRGRWEGNIRSIKEQRPQYYLKRNPIEENETRWKGRIGLTRTVLNPNPIILVYINNIPVKMQVDPRVERTLISKDLANRLKGKAALKFGLRQKLEPILGKPTTAIGTVMPTFKLRGKKLCMPCGIVRAEVTTPCDGILGRDFIEAARLTLDFENAQVVLPHGKLIHFCTPRRPRKRKRRREDPDKRENFREYSDVFAERSERKTGENRPRIKNERKPAIHRTRRKSKRQRIQRENTGMTIESPTETSEEDSLMTASQPSTFSEEDFNLASILSLHYRKAKLRARTLSPNRNRKENMKLLLHIYSEVKEQFQNNIGLRLELPVVIFHDLFLPPLVGHPHLRSANEL
ncbi:uncharacterized protein LOC111617525 [Centruroides sculpturatus]|uniref:uncharacterized protein LOC111617525 n=1 Tax=Centruroides sculpturatus TaxID=218467 RepID=UPI000C6DFADD|nr:uncharacterized protein LOC111617525 [Centruroides sculpturatus]